MFFLILIALTIIAAVLMLLFALVPSVAEKFLWWQKKKEQVVAIEMDKLYLNKSPQEITRLYFILPPILAAAGILFMKSAVFAIVGALLGLYIPNLLIKLRQIRRRQKFSNQIQDAIMILSSCLKGGLSLLQGLEVLTEEMPAPMSQEIGLVVRENKIGITLEESLKRLDKRFNMDDLSLVINSILVAKETGGDLTKVLSRLSTTIRDNRKLKDSINTLTFQGRLQALIMSFLPFLFIWWVFSFNKHHFDIMFQSQTGRFLLILAVILQAVGMILIKKFSTIKI